CTVRATARNRSRPTATRSNRPTSPTGRSWPGTPARCSSRTVDERSVRSPATDRIGVLVVGCGRASGIRVRDAGRIPGVEMRAFCDPVPERAQQRARECGLDGPGTWYGNLAEALDRDDVQVVDVCAPVRFHEEIALQAIAAGKHVLMEKPMAQSLAEADA